MQDSLGSLNIYVRASPISSKDNQDVGKHGWFPLDVECRFFIERKLETRCGSCSKRPIEKRELTKGKKDDKIKEGTMPKFGGIKLGSPKGCC